jgi:prepilin-type N-terminal cleavage/methylation domain-containing protein
VKWKSNDGRAAFTLVELLVAIAVLALLVALIGQLFFNTTNASSISTNHIESDARVRVLFARMASDFSHIVKRSDVDCFLKEPLYPAWSTSTSPTANTQAGNDQIAFFSEVSGYSDVTGVAENSPSLIAYRVNNTGTAPCIERLGKALSWGGGTAGIYPIAFMPVYISEVWPKATIAPASSSTSDPAYDQDYETLVPNAFRFEYYYLLHSGALSATPWDTTATNPVHTTLNGWADVAGIGVVVAVTDRKSAAMASSASLQALAGQMIDFPSAFPSGMSVGSLQQNWQATVTASALPAAVKNGIRVYEQVFSIDTPAQ